MNVTINIVFAFAFAVVLGWFCLSQKRDIIDTSETSSQILFSIIIASFWISTSAFLAFNTLIIIINQQWWLYTNYWNPYSFPFIIFPYIIILLLPPVSAILSYFRIYSYFQKRKRLRKPNKNNDEIKDILLTVKEISSNIGLTKTPKLLYSDLDSTSPFVFSTSFSNIFLVLPSNFSHVINSVSERIPERPVDKIVKQIRDFIIVHELSHIKNKDVLMASWTYIFFNSMKYYSVFLLPINLFYVVFFDIVIFKTSYNLIIFSIPLIFLNLLFLLSSKIFFIKRELLADARVVANVKEDTILFLTEPIKGNYARNLSILEMLLRNFSAATFIHDYTMQKGFFYRFLVRDMHKPAYMHLREIMSHVKGQSLENSFQNITQVSHP